MSVPVFLVYLRDFLTFGHKVLTECGQPGLQALCVILSAHLQQSFWQCRICVSLPRKPICDFPPIIRIFSNAIMSVV